MITTTTRSTPARPVRTISRARGYAIAGVFLIAGIGLGSWKFPTHDTVTVTHTRTCTVVTPQTA